MMIQIEKKKIIDDELGVSFNFTLMYLPRVTRSVSRYVLIQIELYKSKTCVFLYES